MKMAPVLSPVGPLVRTGPNEVVTDDPDAIDLLYGAGSRFEKVGLPKYLESFDLWWLNYDL